MDSATWCRTPAAASAARRLRPEVSKNSSTALSSNDGELASSIATCAPAMASLSPLAGDGVDAAFGRAGDDLVTLFAQNGNGLRADQAGASDNDNLHGLPRLSTIQSCNPGEKSPWISARRKHRGGRLGSTELCNARGIRGSCGGNVSIEHRWRDAELTPMPGLASLALAASM